MILSPLGRPGYRRIVVGRKKLPELNGERFWGFVDQVEQRPEVVRGELEAERYETATRGERFQPGARPAGEGVYAIVRHQDHVHLAYQLELPEQPGDVQRELKIQPEASYVIVAKNPGASSPPGVGRAEAQRRFRGRRFIQGEPQYLDAVGAEIILIGADEDVPGELGIRLQPEHETLDTSELFRDLRLKRSEIPTEPLTEGEWR